MDDEIGQLTERYLDYLRDNGGDISLPDEEEDHEIVAALVQYGKGKIHSLAQEHIQKTIRFIATAPINNKNHGRPEKKWLYSNQEKAGLKGDEHLKKFGFFQTFSKRGLADDSYLKDVTEEEGGLP